jgi:hypothetical protein
VVSSELQPFVELLEVLAEIQRKAEVRAEEILAEREAATAKKHRNEGGAP